MCVVDAGLLLTGCEGEELVRERMTGPIVLASTAESRIILPDSFRTGREAVAR